MKRGHDELAEEKLGQGVEITPKRTRRQTRDSQIPITPPAEPSPTPQETQGGRRKGKHVDGRPDLANGSAKSGGRRSQALNRTDGGAGVEREVEVIQRSHEPEVTPSRARRRPRSPALKASPRPDLDHTVSTPTKQRPQQTSTPNHRATSGADLTPSRAAAVQRSARRRSVRVLMQDESEMQDDDGEGVGDEEEELARQIYAEQDEFEGEESSQSAEEVQEEAEQVEDGPVETVTEPITPTKRKRGRPRKQPSQQRTPSPPRDLAPHEKYFFQNRPGGTKTSGNTLAKFVPLTHEDYFSILESCGDPHQAEIDFLHDLHSRAFSQWAFEMEEGYSICLHGYGSKISLLRSFAKFLYNREAKLAKMEDRDAGPIVFARAHHISLDFKALLSSILVALDEKSGVGLPAKPAEALATTLEQLSATKSTQRPLTLLLSSIDSSISLTAPGTFPLLIQLVSHPQIHLLLTTSHPSFTLLLTPSLRQQLNLIFHDATTFLPYSSAELDVVGTVDELLGRSARKIKGRGGVAFVLKSLTENARRLYAMLAGEQLTALAEAADNIRGTKGTAEVEELDGGDEGPSGGGMEYRSIYRKSVEEFICSSEAAFKTLLKEFHDHQMIESRREAGGAEILRIPFRQEELESILEDLT